MTWASEREMTSWPPRPHRAMTATRSVSATRRRTGREGASAIAAANTSPLLPAIKQLRAAVTTNTALCDGECEAGEQRCQAVDRPLKRRRARNNVPNPPNACFPPALRTRELRKCNSI